MTGEGKNAALLKEQLAAAGIECLSVSGTAELKDIVPTLPVLLYINCEPPRFVGDEAYLRNVMHGLGAKDDVVFLMDAAADNTDYDFYLVFEAARKAALYQRPVTVLAKSVRANYPGAEEKYAAAREAGVRFMHYDDVEVLDGEGGAKIVRVTDGADKFEIVSPCFVDCAPGCCCASVEAAKALGLKLYKGRYITGGHWFDHNKSTSRRNVFVVYDKDIKEDGDLGTLIQDILNTQQKARTRIAMVDKTKCAFCYTCNRICPHGAAQPDLEARAMNISKELCEGCGACVSICPAQAISWDEPLAIAASDAPIIALCCENSGNVAASALAGMNVKVEKIPCGGVIASRTIAELLGTYKGVLVAVCINGACKHYEGNLRAIANVEKTKKELAELGLDPARLELVQVAGSMENILLDAVKSFEGRISE